MPSLLLLSALLAAGPGPDRAAFFENKVRPLLAEHCISCHGPQKQKGGLRLDSRETLLQGGDLGPAVVPGKPAESLLLKAVGYADESLRMPPRGKLTDRQIADLTQWVTDGAEYPSAAATAKAASAGGGRDAPHWAFQPLSHPAVPAVKDAAWCRSPLDRFVLAKLEAAGLRPAPEADRRTLIRRATFDLLGLPPTPAEVDAFVRDPRPDAYEQLIDRLLASPAYGERWGRHWIDVARYADSNGLDENVAHGNAWRYRDYVVDAFNADKPYDQFVREQVAGDLLPPAGEAARRERLIATGFLSLGPKVLAEVDKVKMEMDIVDEQLDTAGKAFLALTLGCARCHDHKFDPISQADYYALAGVFKSTRTMSDFKTVAKWNEAPLAAAAEVARRADFDKKIAAKKAEVDKAVARGKEALAKTAKENKDSQKDEKPAKGEDAFPADVKAELAKLRAEQAVLTKAAPVIPTAMAVEEGTPADTRIHIRGSHLTLGKVVPRGVPRVLAGDRPPVFDPKASGRLQLAEWMASPDHPLTARVFVNRVWRWHFGQGIVPTPDNFGKLGQRPINPALLDWLARDFVAGGWSVKALHRTLMRSATYRMSAAYDAAAALADPDNRLHWRAEPRRLEAEAVRDAVLAVSGRLDRTMGGSLLHVENRGYLFDHTSKDGTRYDSRRRALYLPVIRNNVYDVFQLFDAPDFAVPSGDRATTTVASQALFMLNSELVADAADALAGELLAGPGDDAARVGRLYARAYGRPPVGDEVGRSLELVRSLERAQSGGPPEPAVRSRRAWAGLCQVTMAASEFIYVK
jgi:cytochrome c553